MADVAWLDLTSRGAEARLRSLMEDIVDLYKGGPESRLALALWFGERTGSVQKLLVLSTGLGMSGVRSFAEPVRYPLLLKTGSGPPFVEVSGSSVEHFDRLLSSRDPSINQFMDRPDVLYSDKALLSDAILTRFNVVTEPTGLMKGWYVDIDQAKGKTPGALLSRWGGSRPYVGLVKTWESADFENCRGLLHVESSQRWLPLSLVGLRNYTFFNDLQAGKAGFFLFRGGSFYQPLKFEEKAAPDYSKLVLERLPDDRYPEVYLRSVHPSAEPAA